MFLFGRWFCQISLISKKFTQILKINKKFAYTSTAARSSMSMFCRWRWPRFWFDLKKLEVKKWGWPTKCFFWPMKANHTALATGADLADFLTGHQGWPQIDFCWSCCDFTRFFDHAAISRDFSVYQDIPFPFWCPCEIRALFLHLNWNTIFLTIYQKHFQTFSYLAHRISSFFAQI